MNRPPDSLYDPSGFVWKQGERIFRIVLKNAQKDWQSFVESGLFSELQEKGYLQSSKILPLQDCPYKEAAVFIGHQKIPCISYPYEWSFSMLKDAALFHLDLVSECLQKGFITKDGTGYNIQFLGTDPVFIDLLSFIPYKKGSPWLGFTQFCQLFLFPLFIYSYKEIPFHPWLKSEPEGIDVLSARKFFSLTDILRKPGLFFNVFLASQFQKRFSRRKESFIKKISSEQVIDRKTIGSLILKIRKTIKSLPLIQSPSTWEKYQEDNTYSPEDKKAKHRFVSEAMEDLRPEFVLDLGANTGEYIIPHSFKAKYIVALDSDYQAVDVLYRRLKKKGLKNIIPLVGDIVNPSPSRGWDFKQRESFFDRFKPNLVLSLALVHHIAIKNNIPLENFIKWISNLSPNLIIEFIEKKDPMVKMLLKEKEDVYPDYNIDNFEKCLCQRGEIIKKLRLSSGFRTLYFLKRK